MPQDSTETFGGAVEADVALTPEHSAAREALAGFAAVGPHRTRVTLPLVAGTSVITTPPRPVGEVPGFDNPELMATLSVWYDWDPATRVLTLCAPELVSSDSTFLSTFPAGSERAARHYSHGKPAERKAGAWTTSRALAPGLADALAAAARDAQQAIIDAAIAAGLNVALRTPVPELTPEELADLRLVYRRGIFSRSYDPAVPLAEDEVVFSIQSVWGGTVTFKAAEAFANVIGSTGDPKIGGLSWIALWRNQFGNPPQCASLSFPAGFSCTPAGPKSPLGGHVIVGKVATKVPWGVNYVYIMPICSAHNNDDNVYMEALKTRNGIWLKNYHQ
jgi:hypothetical protein